MFKFRLIPKEEKFFDDFAALADRIVSGATLLERMLSSDPPAWDTALQIRQVDSRVDRILQLRQTLTRDATRNRCTVA